MEIRLSEKVLIELENELNEIAFLGMPLGGVMANTFLIEFIYGNRNWNSKQYFIDLIASMNLRFRKNRGVFSKKPGDTVP